MEINAINAKLMEIMQNYGNNAKLMEWMEINVINAKLMEIMQN